MATTSSLSAPDEFGKSLIIDALIATGKYQRRHFVPTIALIDETRRGCRAVLGPNTRSLLTPSQARADEDFFVLTQRALQMQDEPLDPILIFL